MECPHCRSYKTSNNGSVTDSETWQTRWTWFCRDCEKYFYIWD